MAHECPECGMTCHCGGDIDDIIFHDTEEEYNCRCCDDEKREEEYDEDADCGWWPD